MKNDERISVHLAKRYFSEMEKYKQRHQGFRGILFLASVFPVLILFWLLHWNPLLIVAWTTLMHVSMYYALPTSVIVQIRKTLRLEAK
jgi:hypothetical protein